MNYLFGDIKELLYDLMMISDFLIDPLRTYNEITGSTKTNDNAMYSVTSLLNNLARNIKVSYSFDNKMSFKALYAVKGYWSIIALEAQFHQFRSVEQLPGCRPENPNRSIC